MSGTSFPGECGSAPPRGASANRLQQGRHQAPGNDNGGAVLTDGSPA